MSLNSIPIIASLTDTEQLLEAAGKGIFYFKFPDNLQENVQIARDFCYDFPHNAETKMYSDGKFGGYHERLFDQIESFYVEKIDWKNILSPKLCQLASKMNSMTISILQSILEVSGIPSDLWNQGTADIMNGFGQYHFSFNHYRPEKNTPGLKAHRDFGFVSMLFIEKSGLEACVQNEWINVDPIENHFIVIIGKAFENLINNPKIVSSAEHRVRQLYSERVSFGITSDGNGDSALMRYNHTSNQLEVVNPCYDAYIEECFEKLY